MSEASHSNKDNTRPDRLHHIHHHIVLAPHQNPSKKKACQNALIHVFE
jgi:hypothetical protein